MGDSAMAEQQHQQQDLRAGHQHLAHLRQVASALPAVVLVQHQHQPQVGLAEAGLEAHLQQLAHPHSQHRQQQQQ
jgi:hypothetical protein